MPAASHVELLPMRHVAGAATRLWQRVPLLCGLLLVVLLLFAYAAEPAVPGNHGQFPAGWWGWWDQSRYLASARALAHLDFDPALHWYPLGYAILGAPFTLLSRLHAYLLPDLICCVATYCAFLVFSRTVGIGPSPAGLLFLLATTGSAAVRSVWAEPWNTTLSAALIWWLLALTARHLSDGETAVGRQRWLRCLAMGAIAGFMPVTRPTDALLVAIWAVGAGAAGFVFGRLRPSDLAGLVLGGLLVLAPSAGLWAAIHGLGASEYMRDSALLGFDPGTLLWRTYLLMLAPQPWFPDGPGMVQRLPWLLPGLAGMAVTPWLVRGPARSLLLLLATMIVLYSLLFCSYVDLIPPGLWRYNNIHYFKWTLPGMALFAALLLRHLFTGPYRGSRVTVLLTASLCAALLYALRWSPCPVDESRPAWMVQFQGPAPTWDGSYFGGMTVEDDRGELRNVIDFRAMPDEQGWRLVALRRPFEGPLLIGGIGHWPDGIAPPVGPGSITHRWGRRLTLRLPGHPPRAPHP